MAEAGGDGVLEKTVIGITILPLLLPANRVNATSQLDDAEGASCVVSPLKYDEGVDEAETIAGRY